MKTLLLNKPFTATIPDEERDLVRRAQRSGPDATRALGEIWEANRMYVYNLASRMLRNHHDAEEAVSQVAVKFVRKFEIFKGNSTVRTWIHSVTLTTCLNIIKQRNRDQSRMDLFPVYTDGDHEGEEKEFPEEKPSAVQRIMRREDYADLETAIRMLSWEHQIIIILYFFVGLGDRELALECNISRGTARSRVFYAKKYLRSSLQFIRLREKMKSNGISLR